jgi:excinuclease ABC subunit C
MSQLAALPLASADLGALRERVRLLAENRPAVYRMTDPAGRLLYVGKAKRLRARLMTYFRASFPDDKAARILHAAGDITWDYVHSDFAAGLGELRQIRQFRPPFNVAMNRTRRAVFVKILDSPAPKVYQGATIGRQDGRVYGPFRSRGRVEEALRVLNDLLGLRDCEARMPIVFADQGDLFTAATQAACHRHELGQCTGPCAGLVSEVDYRRRVETAAAFLEGRTIQPIDQAIMAMQEAAVAQDYERAAKWRERFEHLEWLLAATAHSRAAVDLLTFVYRDPGVFGDDRAYLVRRGTVRACFPYPTTPIERIAFGAVVKEELTREEPASGPLPLEAIDEILLLMSWFRGHPDALKRTTPMEEWPASPYAEEVVPS